MVSQLIYPYAQEKFAKSFILFTICQLRTYNLLINNQHAALGAAQSET